MTVRKGNKHWSVGPALIGQVGKETPFTFHHSPSSDRSKELMSAVSVLFTCSFDKTQCRIHSKFVLNNMQYRGEVLRQLRSFNFAT